MQGVGYRAWCVAMASGLGLSGWVRNRLDGSVEALARGSADALLQFEAACRRGPPGARVDHILCDDAAEIPRPGFVRRPTG